MSQSDSTLHLKCFHLMSVCISNLYFLLFGKKDILSLRKGMFWILSSMVKSFKLFLICVDMHISCKINIQFCLYSSKNILIYNIYTDFITHITADIEFVCDSALFASSCFHRYWNWKLTLHLHCSVWTHSPGKGKLFFNSWEWLSQRHSATSL